MTNFRQGVIWILIFGTMLGTALIFGARTDRRTELVIEPEAVRVHRWSQSPLRTQSLVPLDWGKVPRDYKCPLRVTIDESMHARDLLEWLNLCGQFGHAEPAWRIGDGVETVYEMPVSCCSEWWPEESAEDLSVTDVRRRRICYLNLTITPDGLFLNDIPMTLNELEHAIDTAAGNRPIDQGFMMLTIELETELSSLQNLMALIAQDGWKYQMTFPDESS